MRHCNDYYNQRSTADGLRRIFRLFDNDGNGVIDRQEMELLNEVLDNCLSSEQLEEMFTKAS